MEMWLVASGIFGDVGTVAVAAEGGPKLVGHLVQPVGSRRGLGIAKIEISHAIDRNNVDMGMRNFETGDHQTDPSRSYHSLLCVSDRVSHGHEMGCGF